MKNRTEANEKVVKLIEAVADKYRRARKLCVDKTCRQQFGGAIGACRDIIEAIKKAEK